MIKVEVRFAMPTLSLKLPYSSKNSSWREADHDALVQKSVADLFSRRNGILFAQERNVCESFCDYYRKFKRSAVLCVTSCHIYGVCLFVFSCPIIFL